MPLTNPILTKSLLARLYIDERLSLSQIAYKLDISVHKVTYWLYKYRIKTRSLSEAIYLWFNPNGDPFKVKKHLNRNEIKLKYLALGLYWGEGTKASKNSVRVGNTDPALIKKFQEFLLQVCQVKKTKIHYWLQTFKDNNVEIAQKFWADRLMINSDQIATYTPIKSLGKGTYKKINQHGVLTISVGNTKLKHYLDSELDKLGHRQGVPLFQEK